MGDVLSTSDVSLSKKNVSPGVTNRSDVAKMSQERKIENKAVM